MALGLPQQVCSEGAKQAQIFHPGPEGGFNLHCLHHSPLPVSPLQAVVGAAGLPVAVTCVAGGAIPLVHEGGGDARILIGKEASSAASGHLEMQLCLLINLPFERPGGSRHS